jgi:tetratricopeptide (TPR) repeat protein
MFVMSLENIMRHQKNLYGSLTRFALSFALTLLCGLAVVAQAQTDQPSGSTETRARRAPVADNDAKEDETASGTMEDVTVGSQPEAQPDKATSSKASSGAAKDTKDNVRGDRVASLRAQIKDAKTEIERVRLQRTLVDYLVALNRRSEAVSELRSMLGAERLDAASYYNIGNGLARLGEAEHAVAAYRKAIEGRQGNYPRALNNMGVMLIELNRLDEAYDAFVLAVKHQNFRYAEATYNIGKLHAMRDEADLAINEWTRALKVQPDHIDSAVALARAYAATGQQDRALDVIEATIKRAGANERLEALRDEINSNAAARR